MFNDKGHYYKCDFLVSHRDAAGNVQTIGLIQAMDITERNFRWYRLGNAGKSRKPYRFEDALLALTADDWSNDHRAKAIALLIQQGALMTDCNGFLYPPRRNRVEV